MFLNQNPIEVLLLLFFYFAMLEIEPKDLHVVDKDWMTK